MKPIRAKPIRAEPKRVCDIRSSNVRSPNEFVIFEAQINVRSPNEFVMFEAQTCEAQTSLRCSKPKRAKQKSPSYTKSEVNNLNEVVNPNLKDPYL